MDLIDRNILDLLQADASLSIAEIAKKVCLSQTPCWKRIQKLENLGIIKGRVALLDSKKLNLGLTVFVQLKTDKHDERWLTKFAETVRDMPEVVEVYRMAGEIDYLLRVVVSDTDSYDHFYKALIKKVPLNDVSSSFAMEEIKYTTALPIKAPNEQF
ncbi:MAG: transcriptional regulator [Alphaproteobacteria bacterium TMED87]|nr:transcriptional regulator [Rhodospirillaceae bacterium]OUV08012.1 MAG: transcriptional regulator [Alphaproteobacteria bacterium TMED87]